LKKDQCWRAKDGKEAGEEEVEVEEGKKDEDVERKLKQRDPVIVAPVYLTVVGLLRGVSAC
jgi:hypothetical protein